MVKRNLDGVYFRVLRDGKWDNVCFTDLTDDEMERVIDGRSKQWWMGMALHLCERLRFIGVKFDLYMGDEDE